ncbi:MAG: Ig-like domain-containing protein [Bacteroidetes bacterium]|nr:Ig-like domain-containing protein [Bacteroidota bacterium]
MKKIKWMMSVVVTICAVAAIVLVQSCSKSDTPPALTLVSLKVGTIDLNGATSATGVPVVASIIATFSTSVDETSATSAITLVRDYDQAAVASTIQVSGSTVTITPNADLNSGALFDLNLAATLKSSGGKFLTAVSRTFTTAGFFVPDGQIAHWGFESSTIDDAGSGTNYNPGASDVVDLTYAAGRNTSAGQAASFNGTTTIVEVPNGSSLINTNDFTLSFWAKLSYNITSASDTIGHFVMGLGGFDGFEWEFSNMLKDGKMAAQYKFGSSASANSGGEDLWMDCTGNLGWQGWTYSKDLSASGGLPAVINNKWVNIICTYNSSTKVGSIYMNGTLMKTQNFNNWPAGDDKTTVTGLTLNTTAVSASSKLAFGFYCDRATGDGVTFPWATYSDVTSNHFKGLLDDVRIFHKALSQDEVTLMYNSENQ